MLEEDLAVLGPPDMMDVAAIVLEDFRSKKDE
jgi:hypothetical protein